MWSSREPKQDLAGIKGESSSCSSLKFINSLTNSQFWREYYHESLQEMWQFFKEKRDMSNTGKLQGNVALITGASSGIGEARKRYKLLLKTEILRLLKQHLVRQNLASYLTIHYLPSSL